MALDDNDPSSSSRPRRRSSTGRSWSTTWSPSRRG